MDRLDAMAIFMAVIDEGSLSAAAIRLGQSPATVTRAIKLLEAGVGDRLLYRSARRFQLTELGHDRLDTYRAVLAQLGQADQRLPHDKSRLDGLLTISAPELFGRLRVLPIVERFVAEHPGVRLRMLFVNRIVNLVEEGVDLAVRLAPLADSSLKAVRLGQVRWLLCASPDYLKNAVAISRPSDLSQHDCIGVTKGGSREIWRFVKRNSGDVRTVTVAIKPRFALSSAGAAIDCAIRGNGICRAFSYQVAGDVAAGRLVMLLPRSEPAAVPVSLLFHPIPERNLVLRAFVDFAAPMFRAELSGLARSLKSR